jgi:hypothetical protein
MDILICAIYYCIGACLIFFWLVFIAYTLLILIFLLVDYYDLLVYYLNLFISISLMALLMLYSCLSKSLIIKLYSSVLVGSWGRYYYARRIICQWIEFGFSLYNLQVLR